jgi:GNAT superfamily N-acetyltransferase
MSVTYRAGTAEDSYAVFYLFEETIADLVRRFGVTIPTSISSPQALAKMWDERRSLYDHLARTADQYWIAEQAGEIIGFSRAIMRGGMQELTELFVKPEIQSSGVGRELITRALPSGAAHRTIIATPDFRAQALYLKMGVYPRFPIYYFGRTPDLVPLETDLGFVPAAESLEALAGIDQQILGHRRDVDHQWLLSERQGFLYTRAGQIVGYGYAGHRNGPFALLNAADFPAVLAHAESEAARQGRDHFGVEVPTINQTALSYLVSRGFKLDSFMAIFMSDAPLGKFENYIVTSPPFFM